MDAYIPADLFESARSVELIFLKVRVQQFNALRVKCKNT